jgi:hypothetical protein
MTYPFAGVIKMEKIKDEDGNDKVVWDYSAPIIGPYTVKPDPSMNLGIGKHTDAYGDEYALRFTQPTEWARIDKNLKLVHLDMDLCAKGPANAYTALAVGIWNAAIEAAAKQVDHILSITHATQGDVIRELKK